MKFSSMEDGQNIRRKGHKFGTVSSLTMFIFLLRVMTSNILLRTTVRNGRYAKQLKETEVCNTLY